MDKTPDWNDVAKEGPDAVRDAFDQATKAPPPSVERRRWRTAADLQNKRFDPIKFIVQGYIAEGCTLFAGRPKMGKSWLMLEIAVGVARGDTCLGGIQCHKGEVLYLALEDNERRLQSRLTKLIGASRDEWPADLAYATEWPRLREGGVDAIRDWIKNSPSPALVVVDVLAMVRSQGRANEVYQGDYDTIKSLQSLSLETGVAIVIVTHVRKGGAEGDPFEKVSGTLGLSGAADTVLILDRDGNGTTLYGRGRDIEEIETAVLFDKESCRWQILGDPVEVRRTDARSKILDALWAAEEPMDPRTIALETASERNNIDQLLLKMGKAGEVLKVGRGRYVHPDRTDLLQKPGLDKNDKRNRNDKSVRREGTRAEGNRHTDKVVDLTSYRSYPSREQSAELQLNQTESEVPGDFSDALEAPASADTSAVRVYEEKRGVKARGEPARPDDDDLTIPDFLDRSKHPRPGDHPGSTA